jgi:hypothetical protein
LYAHAQACYGARDTRKYIVRACAGLLPDYMKGEFQLEGSEGYTNFLYELGIDFFTRYFMNSLTPIQKIR